MKGELIEKLCALVKQSSQLSEVEYTHLITTLANARQISKLAEVDSDIIELAIPFCLYIRTWDVDLEYVQDKLEAIQVPVSAINNIKKLLFELSEGWGDRTTEHSVESQIIQDAFSLGKLGYTGIVRSIVEATQQGCVFIDSCVLEHVDNNEEKPEYNTNAGYEKIYANILSLPKQMNTEAAKTIARGRIIKMNAFLSGYNEETKGLA